MYLYCPGDGHPYRIKPPGRNAKFVHRARPPGVVSLETEKGEQRKILNPNDVPKAVFTIEDDKAVAVYR